MAKSGIPSLLKSPVAMDRGLAPVGGFEGFRKFSEVADAPNAAVPKTAFPLLVSRKETVPVGEADAPLPATVAVSV